MERSTSKLQKSCPREGPAFGPALCEIRAPGFRFSFRLRPLGGLVSLTFWLQFLLQSRLVPVTSPENWFPLWPKWFPLYPAPIGVQGFLLTLLSSWRTEWKPTWTTQWELLSYKARQRYMVSCLRVLQEKWGNRLTIIIRRGSERERKRYIRIHIHTHFYMDRPYTVAWKFTGNHERSVTSKSK